MPESAVREPAALMELFELVLVMRDFQLDLVNEKVEVVDVVGVVVLALEEFEFEGSEVPNELAESRLQMFLTVCGHININLFSTNSMRLSMEPTMLFDCLFLAPTEA